VKASELEGSNYFVNGERDIPQSRSGCGASPFLRIHGKAVVEKHKSFIQKFSD